MKLTLSPASALHLRWLIERDPDEVSVFGILEKSGAGDLTITRLIMPDHESSPAYTDIDMVSLADLQAKHYDEDGIQPWQWSCWIHTHPSGVDRPSGTDEATMTRLSGWKFAIMLIHTHDGKTYCKVAANATLVEGVEQRISWETDVEVDWKAASAVDLKELIGLWEAEYKARCHKKAKIGHPAHDYWPSGVDYTKRQWDREKGEWRGKTREEIEEDEAWEKETAQYEVDWETEWERRDDIIDLESIPGTLSEDEVAKLLNTGSNGRRKGKKPWFKRV